jgi:hypothetical protein
VTEPIVLVSIGVKERASAEGVTYRAWAAEGASSEPATRKVLIAFEFVNNFQRKVLPIEVSHAPCAKVA